MSKVNTASGYSTAQGWLAGALTWAIPGAGHFWLGSRSRGLILGGSVLLMFFLGLQFGGHLYGPHGGDEIGLLAYVYGFCNLGLGLVYFLSLWLEIGLTDQAARPTAEYGNIFLIIAGLLNYLSMLDAFDLSVRRKT